MRTGAIVLWGVAAVVGAVAGTGTSLAQEAPESAGSRTEGRKVSAEVPCLIDEGLSLWLSLEAVDRTIVGLERERRALTADLANAHKALDLLARADDRDGVPFTQLSELAQAQAIGRDVIDKAYAELQNGLIEIEKTLTRRRKQQAMLEERLDESQRARRDDSR